MRPWRVVCVMSLAMLVGACKTEPPRDLPSKDYPTKGFPTASDVRDSAYLAVDRAAPAPAGYGLYTVLLSRSADRNTVRVLSELFATTGGSDEAALARENLNLITIPVKSVPEASRVLASARHQPEATASTLMRESYDFGQATMLMASVCHPARGAAVLKACGSQSPDGPLLVTAPRPLDAAPASGQPLLIVNLATTPPQALREVLAAYRRQILRRDFADRAELTTWRLRALNQVLEAAQLLPGISKAYAGSK